MIKISISKWVLNINISLLQATTLKNEKKN